MICKQFVVSRRFATAKSRGRAEERISLSRVSLNPETVKIKCTQEVLRIGVVVACSLEAPFRCKRGIPFRTVFTVLETMGKIQLRFGVIRNGVFIQHFKSAPVRR